MAGLAGSAAISGYRVGNQNNPNTMPTTGNPDLGQSRPVDNGYNRVENGDDYISAMGGDPNSKFQIYQGNTFRASNPYVDPNAYNFGGSEGGAQGWIDANNAASQAAQGRQGPDLSNNAYGLGYQHDLQGIQSAANAQGQALNNYQGVINGTAPSVAQNQLAMGQQANTAAAQSLAAGARGGGANMAAAQRMAMNQGSQSGANLNQQASLLRANEVNQAMGGVSGQANALRSGAQSQANTNANLAQSQGQLDQNATGQNDQMAQFYGKQNFDVANAQLQAQQQRYAQQSQNSMGAQKINADINGANADSANKASGGIMGGAMSAIGGLAMFSDMRLKENVKPAGDDRWAPRGGQSYAESTPRVGDTLAAMQPYSYQYKDPAMGQGQRAGIMAQDLEKTPLGKAAVMNTPQGKAIDMKAATSIALAGGADHERRLRTLEADMATYSALNESYNRQREIVDEERRASGKSVGAVSVENNIRLQDIMQARQDAQVKIDNDRMGLLPDGEDYPAKGRR